MTFRIVSVHPNIPHTIDHERGIVSFTPAHTGPVTITVTLGFQTEAATPAPRLLRSSNGKRRGAWWIPAAQGRRTIAR